MTPSARTGTLRLFRDGIRIAPPLDLQAAAGLGPPLGPRAYREATDGKMHTYTVDLTKVPRWRRLITTVRFDPCSAQEVEVIIDEIRLK